MSGQSRRRAFQRGLIDSRLVANAGRYPLIELADLMGVPRDLVWKCARRLGISGRFPKPDYPPRKPPVKVTEAEPRYVVERLMWLATRTGPTGR